jgi:hypothetical protein
MRRYTPAKGLVSPFAFARANFGADAYQIGGRAIWAAHLRAFLVIIALYAVQFH